MVVFLQPASKVFVAVSIIALQLSLESYLELPLSITIDSKPLQPEKAKSPIEVTELGISIDVKPLQLLKHSAGICDMPVKYLNSLNFLILELE